MITEEVCVININPSSCQVGLAMLDLSSMRLTLVQVIEPSSTYAHVLALLAAVQPEHLLVVDSAQASCSGLNTATRTLYNHVAVPRAFFDDAKVLFLVHHPCSRYRSNHPHRHTRNSTNTPATPTSSACGNGSTCSLPATWRLALQGPSCGAWALGVICRHASHCQTQVCG